VSTWADDEVVVTGAGSGEGHQDFSILFAVKNVAGLKDGTYEIRPPTAWESAPRTLAADGIVDAAPQPPLSLAPADDVIGWGWWDIKVAEVDPDRIRDPVTSFFDRTSGDGSKPGDFRRLGASVVRSSGREYHVIVWGEDAATNHWLRLGTVTVGHGSQLPGRKATQVVAFPVALVADVVIFPFAALYTFIGYELGLVEIPF
jgi:hypothetical protein